MAVSGLINRESNTIPLDNPWLIPSSVQFSWSQGHTKLNSTAIKMSNVISDIHAALIILQEKRFRLLYFCVWLNIKKV